jgi:hypothetical protein
MTFRTNRVAVFTALVLTSPLLSLAGGQPSVRPAGKSEIDNRGDITRAVQQGKRLG